MMEIQPELQNPQKKPKNRKSFQRRKSQSFDVTGDFLDDLVRVRSNLLQKANQNVLGYELNRNSFWLTDEQLKSIASMLPDEIIHQGSSYELRKFEAAVFFADISGFTDLSEKYKNLENGASKLSMVLNFYLGSMVQEILSLGGDIIKYAGDAFIASFRAENEENLQEAVNKAIDAALIIQKNCSNYHTTVADVILNVKIAISAGQVHFANIGNELSSHYAVLGDPVWQVKSLQECIKSGEVLVTSKAWFYAKQAFYAFEHNKDLKHYKVTGYSEQTEVNQRHYDATLSFYARKKKADEDNEIGSKSVTLLNPSVNQYSLDMSLEENDHFALRQSIDLSMEMQAKKFLCRFIIPPVLKCIYLNESIELLTEMRNVVIVFANFIVERQSSEKLIHTINSIYNTMTEIVTLYEGIVNKVSLFDKDMMFLIVFGLRGFKHQLESRRGLRCAAELLETFKTWPDVVSVAFGVTTGMSYCGVVGHTLRREYSVISSSVNKAARFMIAYPEIVSCDNETMLYSRMDSKNFNLLPKKKLKGLDNNVIAYEFKEIFEEMEPIRYEHPIVGRHEVLELSKQLLKAALVSLQSKSVPECFCLVIEDNLQLGKTRLLNEIFLKCLQEGFMTFRLTMSLKHLKTSYFTIRKIVEILLGVKSETFESNVRKKLAQFNVDSMLSALNPILNTNFQQSDFMKKLDDGELSKARTLLLKLLLTQTTTESFFVLLIDDLEYIDQESLELIDCLFETNSIFLFVTLGQQRKLNDAQVKMLKSNRTTRYRLQPIETMNQIELACQFLCVSALSPELESYLQKSSGGNPGWIETCTKLLLHSNKLEIKTISTREALERRMTFIVRPDADSLDGDFGQLHRRHFVAADSTNEEGELKVAMLKVASQVLETDFFMNSQADTDLMVYDSLTSYEQLLCKCASVIGIEFTRHILFYVMSSSTDRMIGKAIVTLFRLQIFACTSESCDDECMQKKSNDNVTCNCKNLVIFDSCRDLPPYACCVSIKFQRESFCSVVYETLTDKQRVEYHRRALLYLHMETKKCDACGNGHFTELMLEDFDFKFHDGVLEHRTCSFDLMVDFFQSINLPIKRPSKSSPMLCIARKKPSKTYPVVLNFLNYDFRHCSCILIVYQMYNGMLRHSRGAELKLKHIETKIELASVCIDLANIPRATKLLTMALQKLKNHNREDDECYLKYLQGRALTLQGVCLSRMMRTETALELCYEACRLFEVSFPRAFGFKSRLKLRQLINGIKKSVGQKEEQNCSRLVALVTVQVARTLSIMFDLLYDTKQFKLARLAAFWSLEKILKHQRNFRDIAVSFLNAVKIIHRMSSVDEFLWLQEAALEQVVRTLFVDGVNLYGLTALIELYHVIMLKQITAKNFRDAIRIGEISEMLCSKVQLTALHTEVIPPLFLLLLSMKRLTHAHALLQRFETAVRFMLDENGLVWYFALSMDVLLDTGFTIVPYDECNEFFERNLTVDHIGALDEACSRLGANLMLFRVRHKVQDMTSTCNIMDRSVEMTINGVFTGLRIMETLTLQFTHALESKNLNLVPLFQEKTHKLMKELRAALKVVKCFDERFVLHQTHFAIVGKFNTKHLKSLEKLLIVALKNKNFCSHDIIKHTLRGWRRELSPEQENFWLKHSTKEHALHLLEVPFDDRVFPYSLALPAPSGSLQ